MTNLVGGLTTHAADSLGAMGSDLFGKGMAGTETAFKETQTMHDQTEAMFNDIFKSSAQVASGIAGGVGTLDTTGSSSFGEQVGNFLQGA